MYNIINGSILINIMKHKTNVECLIYYLNEVFL